MGQVRRRQFLFTAGAFLAAPLSAIAQQAGTVRRIAVAFAVPKADAQSQEWVAGLMQGLKELGWKVGSNLRVEYRFGEGIATRMPKLVKELLETRPEVIVAGGIAPATAFREQTLSIPIVFVLVPDPVAAGFVNNLARPNGNITGFTNFEFSIGEKWLQLLKDCAPNARRTAVVFDPANPSWVAYMRAIEAAAPQLGLELIPIGVRDALELDRQLGEFSKSPNGTLAALPSPMTVLHRERIISLAAKYHLPAIYPYSYFPTVGGLMSYSADLSDLFRRAASYVDRILKGAKPADLPVQLPTKYEFLVNLKTAKALGLKIPQAVLLRADRVIE